MLMVQHGRQHRDGASQRAAVVPGLRRGLRRFDGASDSERTGLRCGTAERRHTAGAVMRQFGLWLAIVLVLVLVRLGYYNRREVGS